MPNSRASIPRLAGHRPEGISRRNGLFQTERWLLDWASRISWIPVAGVILALWIPLKLLRVAHGDLTTALAILSASNKGTILTGLSVLLAPTGLVLAWAATSFAAAVALGRIQGSASGVVSAARVREASLRFVVLAIPWAVLSWLLVVVAPWRTLPVALLLVAALGFWTARMQRRQAKEPRLPRWAPRSPARLALLVAGVIAGLTFLIVDQALKEPLNDRMWLPPVVMPEEHGAALVGYVLGHEGGRVSVLVDKPRYVITRPDAAQFALCRDSETLFGPSLYDFIAGNARAPLDECV
jgi:hypothetical protein